MQPIIDPIDRDILERELNEERFVRHTNSGKNKIYIINHHNSPNTMLEIGRLRELTFRTAGGGTGKSYDIDDFDTCEKCYQQLLVWNPEDREIVGAYRFIRCKEAEFVDGHPHLSTTEIFKFSENFTKNYLPLTIELGRSWVQPQYQPSEHFRKGLFSLDNLWDGLGAVVAENPDIEYFFGKVTMYTHFNMLARDYILSFIDFFFPDKDQLVWPSHPLKLQHDVSGFLKELQGLSYKEGHAVLNKHVRELGENIPPLVNAYMNLSPSMRSFGTATNPFFGGVEETGLMIYIPDIYQSKRDRHLATYLKEKEERLINRP